jgi:hypothetical protein
MHGQIGCMPAASHWCIQGVKPDMTVLRRLKLYSRLCLHFVLLQLPLLLLLLLLLHLGCCCA